MISAESTFTQSRDVTLTELQNGESVLLNLRTWKYYSLNETGVYILKRATEGVSLPDIASGMSEQWEVTTDDALTAVISLLTELAEENLIDVASADGAK